MKKQYLISLILVGALLVLSSLYTAVKVSGSSEVLMGATTKIKLTDPNSVTPYATSTPTANLIPIANASGTLNNGWLDLITASTINTTTLSLSTFYQNTSTRPLVVSANVLSASNGASGADCLGAEGLIGLATTTMSSVSKSRFCKGTAYVITGATYNVSMIVPVGYFYQITGESSGSGVTQPSMVSTWRVSL